MWAVIHEYVPSMRMDFFVRGRMAVAVAVAGWLCPWPDGRGRGRGRMDVAVAGWPWTWSDGCVAVARRS